MPSSAKLERAVVNRDAGLSAQDLMCSDRFIRSHMRRDMNQRGS